MKEISDRQIERARLGELSEQEYRELVDALEARGEMYRLEKAITKDEEFLQKYPPRMMASSIRTKLIEDEVQAPSDNPFSLRTRAPILALAAALLAVVGAVFIISPAEEAIVSSPDSQRAERAEPPEARRPSTNLVPGGGAKPELVKPEPKWRGENVHQDMVCVERERFEFAADPIEKLSVAPLGPINAYTKDEGKTLVLECHQPGSAMIEIPRQTRRDGRVVNYFEKIHVDVGRKLNEVEEDSVDERVSQLDECKTEQEPPDWFRRAKLTIHWNAAGDVREVQTKGSSAPGPVLDCLTKVVEAWKLPKVAHEVVVREHVIFWENVRGPEAFVDEPDVGVGRPGREHAITKAQTALLSGNNRQAIRYCEAFNKANPPGNRKCHRLLGVAYKQIGEIEKSCRAFERADLEPEHCDD